LPIPLIPPLILVRKNPVEGRKKRGGSEFCFDIILSRSRNGPERKKKKKKRSKGTERRRRETRGRDQFLTFLLDYHSSNGQKRRRKKKGGEQLEGRGEKKNLVLSALHISRGGRPEGEEKGKGGGKGGEGDVHPEKKEKKPEAGVFCVSSISSLANLAGLPVGGGEGEKGGRSNLATGGKRGKEKGFDRRPHHIVGPEKEKEGEKRGGGI